MNAPLPTVQLGAAAGTENGEGERRLRPSVVGGTSLEPRARPWSAQEWPMGRRRRNGETRGQRSGRAAMLPAAGGGCAHDVHLLVRSLRMRNLPATQRGHLLIALHDRSNTFPSFMAGHNEQGGRLSPLARSERGAFLSGPLVETPTRYKMRTEADEAAQSRRRTTIDRGMPSQTSPSPNVTCREVERAGDGRPMRLHEADRAPVALSLPSPKAAARRDGKEKSRPSRPPPCPRPPLVLLLCRLSYRPAPPRPSIRPFCLSLSSSIFTL